MAQGKAKRLAACAAVIGVLLAVGAGTCSAAGSASGSSAQDRALVPFGFKLKASNGYTLSVYGFDQDSDVEEVGGTPDAVYMLLEKQGSIVYYIPDGGFVSSRRIRATIEGIAAIDVHYVPSPKVKTRKRFCSDERIRYEAGHFEGTIEFHGEGGFAEASASRAPAAIDLLTKIGCTDGYGESRGDRAKGVYLEVETNSDAELELDQNDPLPVVGPQVSLRISENHGAARAKVEATYLEDTGPYFALRMVTQFVPASSFTASKSLGSARFEPPSGLFSGIGAFDRDAPRNRRWSGDLTVDVPGHPDLPLVGNTISGYMTHASYFKEKPYPYD